MAKQGNLVTKDYLKAKIEVNAAKTIGRALVAIFRRQTEEERDINSTKFRNRRGFSHAHARIGSIGAKYYMKHQTLEDWQLKSWLKIDKTGYPNICKYARQLNEIANERQRI